MNRTKPLFPPDEVPGDDFVLEDCSAIVVGKKASATGEVIFGHNEDDGGNNVMVQYKVPRATHKLGTFLTFEPECAKIPQVPQTWGYLWSETRADWKASFSDTFINEWGVAVGTDSCANSREDRPELLNGGIGYGLGHLVAQRAKTAKEGVQIAASLIDKYGYTASGRAYIIVDKDEGWVLQVAAGKHYVALRVPDDEVMFIPNWFTIRGVNLDDKENCLASPDLITYAIERGWYSPEDPSNYDDFDFALAYQNPKQRQDGNIVRQKHAWRLILGEEPEDVRIFSAKPPKKISVDDVKNLLRTHYEGTEDDHSQGYKINPHRTGTRTICASTTLESFVIEFRDIPELTCIWRTTSNPCTSPFVPWYLGATEVPPGYGWIHPRLGMYNHFNVPVSDLTYRPGRAWWAFQDVKDLADGDYLRFFDVIKRERDSLERMCSAEQKGFESRVHHTFKEDREKAASMLTDYTNKQADLAWRTWRKLFNELLKLD